MSFIHDLAHYSAKLEQAAEDCLADFESGKRLRSDVAIDLRLAARRVFGEFVDAIRAIPEDGRRAPPDDTYYPKRNDPNLYRELSEPFASEDDAEDALKSFFNEVGRARKKCELPDVVIAVQFSIAMNGTETLHMGTCQFGNELMHEPLAAYAFGKLQAESKERIARLLSGPTEEPADVTEKRAAS